MDKITHEVRLANWKTIVEQCSNRPHGQTVKQWLADNGINEKTYYYWLRRIRREVYSRFNDELPSVDGQAVPEIAFAEISLKNTMEQTFDPFKADVVLRSESLVIGISNSISDRLLEKILEAARHAR